MLQQNVLSHNGQITHPRCPRGARCEGVTRADFSIQSRIAGAMTPWPGKVCHPYGNVAASLSRLGAGRHRVMAVLATLGFSQSELHRVFEDAWAHHGHLDSPFDLPLDEIG